MYPRSAAWASRMRGSSTHHRSDCGMHPQWRCLGSRIEYRMARPRVDSGRGGLGCVVHDGTHQSLGKHCESLPADRCHAAPIILIAAKIIAATAIMAMAADVPAPKPRPTMGMIRFIFYPSGER